MFRACTESEATLLKFVLGSGLRDQEIRHAEWRDIDFRNELVRVTAKPEWGFTPKNWEERIVPLPTVLMDRLRKLKESRNATPNQLVFHNRRGRPDSEMDVIVKRVAQRAGLNCKRCETEHGNKCAEGPYCMNYFLHKFRHTFATGHLRSGGTSAHGAGVAWPSGYQVHHGVPQRNSVERRLRPHQWWRAGWFRRLSQNFQWEVIRQKTPRCDNLFIVYFA